MDKMRRIKNDQIEGIIIKWHIPKINNHVWINNKCSAVAQSRLQLSVIGKNNIRVVSV